MSNEVLELAHEFKGTADHIREKYNSLSEKYEQLEQHVAGIEVAQKGWRPTYGGDVESKSDPMLGDYLRKGIMPGSESKELSVTNDGQGVTVRSEWSDRIFKLVRETSPVRSVASVLTTSTNALEVLVDRDEPQSAWIGEINDRTKTDASFMTRQLIGVDEHYALPEATLQMLEDSSFDVESWLQSKVSSRFTRQENAAFMNGDGNGQPRGILTYTTVPEADFTWGADPATYEIGATFSGAAGDITYSDTLMDLVDSLKAPYLPNAAWMMPRAMRNKVRKLKDSQGRYLFEASLTAGVPDMLLGFPVFLAEDMPTPAADTVGALFGDFGQGYCVVDRLGAQVVRDPYTAPGRVKWYVRKRVGGAVTNPEAIKALILGSEPA